MKLVDEGHTKCFKDKMALQKDDMEDKIKDAGGLSEEAKKNIEKMAFQIAETKELQNDISIKTSRLYQKEKIRLRYSELVEAAKKKEDEEEGNFCEKERKKGTLVFPAIEVSEEIDTVEDTTCIDTNRNELLKAFCSFSSYLDNFFATYIWPKFFSV
jgi:hypothetical protein